MTYDAEEKEPDILELRKQVECYPDQGHYATALRHAEKLVSVKPDHEAYLLRGRCRLALGEPREAGEDAKMAVQLGGSTAWAGVYLYRQCHPKLAEEHDRNLQGMLAAYEQGERDFQGIDLSWTSLLNHETKVTDLRDCLFDRANLMYCDLAGLNLAGASLRHASLDYAYAWIRSDVCVSFAGADLTLATLQGTSFRGPDFRGAVLRNTDFEGASYSYPRFEGAELDAASLRQVHFTDAQMTATDLTGLEMDDSYFACATFKRASLRNASLEGCDLTQADLSDADLTRANLREVSFDEAKAPRATFAKAVLDGANCIRADFSGADFESASLVNAVLRGTDLFDANLSRASLLGSDMWQAATNDDTDFEGATMPDGRKSGFLTGVRKYTESPPRPA